MRSRLTKTPATLPRSAPTPVSFSTIEASVSASSADFSGLSGARSRPRLLEPALHRAVGALQHREVGRALAVGVGVGIEAGPSGETPGGAPSASMTSASLSVAGGRLQRLGLGELGAHLAEGPAFGEADDGQRLVAAHHLLEQADRRRARPDLVAAGADLARLSRPAEPFVEQQRLGLDAGPDPGLGDLARRRAELDRQLDRIGGQRRAGDAATTRPPKPPPPRRRAAAGTAKRQTLIVSRRPRERSTPSPRMSWRLMIMAHDHRHIPSRALAGSTTGASSAPAAPMPPPSCKASSPTTFSPSTRAGPGSPASARPRAGCRPASWSGRRRTTSSCWPARPSCSRRR